MNVFQVENMSKVNVSRYIEGDLFITKQRVGILHNGKVETLVKQTDVRKMVREEVKKVLKDNDKKKT